MESFARAAEKVQPQKKPLSGRGPRQTGKRGAESVPFSFHEPIDDHIIDDSDSDAAEQASCYADTEATWLKAGLNVKTKGMGEFDMQR